MEMDYYLQFKTIIDKLQNIDNTLNLILQTLNQPPTTPKDGD
jgi:hypothetical protein